MIGSLAMDIEKDGPNTFSLFEYQDFTSSHLHLKVDDDLSKLIRRFESKSRSLYMVFVVELEVE
jgi:hypothetical protein